jgi:predicted  nucleic acid-binding Zn-ribbon protein
MHPQLEILLEVQDLKTQRRELLAGGREVQEQVFGLGIDEAVRQIDEKVEEMVESLAPNVRARYHRIATRRERVVVPVLKGVCYGCFVSVPTSVASDSVRNSDVLACENCGSFLYMVD